MRRQGYLNLSCAYRFLHDRSVRCEMCDNPKTRLTSVDHRQSAGSLAGAALDEAFGKRVFQQANPDGA